MQNLAQMESLIAQRERALFDVLVDDLAHWVSETVPSSAAAVAAAESRCRASSAAAATGTDDTAAAATPSIASAAASFGDRRSDFFDSIRDGRVLCALLAAISSQNAPTQTPMRGRSGSSAAASDFQARFVPRAMSPMLAVAFRFSFAGQFIASSYRIIRSQTCIKLVILPHA